MTSKHTPNRNNYKKLFLFICVTLCVLVLLPAANTFAQGSDSATVATASETVVLSNSTTVDVTLDMGSSTTKIGAFTLVLSYDDSIIKVTDCQIADYNGVCNNNVSGELRMTGLDIGGFSGLSTAATLTIEGIALGSTTMAIDEVTTLIDNSAQALESTISAGVVTVVAPAAGTSTPTWTPTATTTSGPDATSTPLPTATSVPVITNTPIATATSAPATTNPPTPLGPSASTSTPIATATSDPAATGTPMSTAPATSTPSNTSTPASTSGNSNVSGLQDAPIAFTDLQEKGTLITWRFRIPGDSYTFRVYRSTSPVFNSSVKLPDSLVSVSDQGSKLNYFEETDNLLEGTYYYWIERLQSNNQVALYGPQEIVVGSSVGGNDNGGSDNGGVSVYLPLID